MMTMGRTRVRYDRFTLRGWEYPFHELRDQGKMAALVPETDEVRLLKLFGRAEPVEIRRGDVAIIYPQIGWPLPPGMEAAPPQLVETIAKAQEAVDRFQAAANAPAPVSSVEDIPGPAGKDDPVEPQMSLKLLSYRKVGETVAEFLSRLTPELMREYGDLTDLQLGGAGPGYLRDIPTNVPWTTPDMTVSERHSEISALLAELQRLGAEAEVQNAC